jgi:L-fucose isomerase-like protein
MCTPFQGDKEAGYAASRVGLMEMTEKLGFELRVIEEGLYTLEQAQTAAEKLRAWPADFVLLQTSSFAPGEFIYEFTSLPAELGIWAVPEGPPAEGGGLPLNSLAAANMYNSIIHTALEDYGKPVKWFYGPPGQDLFDERLGITVRALSTQKQLLGARVGLIGGVAPGFDNLRVDESKLLSRLEAQVVPIDFDPFLARAKEYSGKQLKEAINVFRGAAQDIDENMASALEKSGKVYLAFHDLAQEQDLDAVAVSCWPRFQEEYHLAVCSVLGMLNETGLIAACEGDVYSALSMLALKNISGGGVVTLMDLSAIDISDESVLLWHCGPTAPSLADEQGVKMQPLWLFDGYEGEPIGLHNDLTLKPGRATVFGFTGDFDRVLVLDGEFDNTITSYTGSRGWFKSVRMNGETISVRELVQALMDSGYQHHYPVVYGDWVGESLELAAWLQMERILPRPYNPYLMPG